MEKENNWISWVVIIVVIWGAYSIFTDEDLDSSEERTSYSSARSYEDEDRYYSGGSTFNGYDCTDDCSGHEAGYEWAEDKDIYDESDCGGNSNSFIEGCLSYVEENY